MVRRTEHSEGRLEPSGGAPQDDTLSVFSLEKYEDNAEDPNEPMYKEHR